MARPRLLGTPAFGWKDPDGNPWKVQLEWAEVGGRAEVVGFHLVSYEHKPKDSKGRETIEPLPGGPSKLTTTVLRALNVGTTIEKQRRHFRRKLEELPHGRRADLAAFAAPSPVKVQASWRYPPEHFAEVARVYRDAYAKAQPPTRAVQRHFGVASSTAAKWVRRARDLGYLAETSPGVAGTDLTAAPTKKGARK
jgi:hypothetical protein